MGEGGGEMSRRLTPPPNPPPPGGREPAGGRAARPEHQESGAPGLFASQVAGRRLRQRLLAALLQPLSTVHAVRSVRQGLQPFGADVAPALLAAAVRPLVQAP